MINTLHIGVRNRIVGWSLNCCYRRKKCVHEKRVKNNWKPFEHENCFYGLLLCIRSHSLMNAVNSAILFNNDDLIAFLSQLKSFVVCVKFRFWCSIQVKKSVFIDQILFCSLFISFSTSNSANKATHPIKIEQINRSQRSCIDLFLHTFPSNFDSNCSNIYPSD